MLMLARNDSTSSLGNTISGVSQNAAPLMRRKKKKKKDSSIYFNLFLLNLRVKNPKRNEVKSFLVSSP